MKYIFGLLFAIATLQPLASEEIKTSHQALFESGPLSYTATVGSLPARLGEERAGYIHYIYYQKEGEEARSDRPITFSFNGGPGSSSVWLHLGAFGPKRVRSPEEGQSPAPPYELIDNPDSILDLTDIVFVDPIGTGFSRSCKEEDNARFYSMEGDIESLGDFIRDFITREGRWNSPKYLAGESYGSFRICGLSASLLSRHHLYLNGLILISPAIDFRIHRFDPDNELPYSLFLPSFAATAWIHGRLPGLSLEEAISQAREFACNTFPIELFKRGTIPPHLYKEISFWTGLPLHLIEQERGLINRKTFCNHFMASEQKVVGCYDSRVLGDRLSGYNQLEFCEPSFTNDAGIYTAALNDYLYYDLNCKSEWPRYKILSYDANAKWRFDVFGYPNQLDAIRKTLLANPDMRIFTACGYFDLAIPFDASEYCFKRLHLPRENNVTFGYYEGGHMFYSNPSALKQFKADLTKFYER